MRVKEDHILPGSYGLVVCGGRSSRMGADKSLLRYYEKPQRYHVYEMLQPFCEKVIISCNEEQENAIDGGYTNLADHPSYKNIGPMAALLSAFTQFPGKNLLFIGCDHPFLTANDLQQFLDRCKEDRAAGFYNEKEDIYEPLLAWYPYRSFDELKKRYEAKQFSLQHFLKDSGAVKFYTPNKKAMISVNTHEDFIKVSAQLIHARQNFF